MSPTTLSRLFTPFRNRHTIHREVAFGGWHQRSEIGDAIQHPRGLHGVEHRHAGALGLVLNDDYNIGALR